MSRSLLLFLLLFLLMGPSLIAAQEPDDTIPPCTPEDYQVILEISTEFQSRYADITDAMLGASPDLDQILGDAYSLHVRWYASGYPSLPRCTYALDFGQIAGRLIDETLIALLFLEADMLGLVDAQVESILDVSEDLRALNNRLEALLYPVATPTGAPSNNSTRTIPPTAVCPSLSATCSELTCEQAYACLQAGNNLLDRDDDGVPCEIICPGG